MQSASERLVMFTRRKLDKSETEEKKVCVKINNRFPVIRQINFCIECCTKNENAVQTATVVTFFVLS